MNDLESRYRRALRRYPSGWRRSHEDALIGVLLDNAQAEGRDKMSSADRKDLARTGARLWASRIAAVLLIVVALLLLAHTTALILNGVGPDAQLILSLPQIPAPAIGSVSRAYFIAQPAWVVYLVSVLALLATSIGGTTLALRTIRANRAR